jgi:hypothetical protein
MSELPQANGALGADPLDSRVAGAPGGSRPHESWWVKHGLVSAVSSTPLPGVLLALGIALGADGVNLLSRSVLSYLEPAITAALATAGLLTGLRVDLRRRRELVLLAGGSVEAALTLLLVGGAVTLALRHGAAATDASAVLALLLATAAAFSTKADPSAGPRLAGARLGMAASRIVDLDDLLPVLAGGAVLAVLRAPHLPGAVLLTAQSIVLSATVALAGWLLLERSSAATGQHVFSAGLVLLLGGLAEFLGVSAILNGVVAGLVLNAIGGDARERLAGDLSHVQHPLMVLLLLAAGARVTFIPGVLALVVVFVIVRLLAKLGGGLLLRVLIKDAAVPAEALISPGLLPAAFALNAAVVMADPTGLVLAVTVIGTVFSELFALLLRPRVAR